MLQGILSAKLVIGSSLSLAQLNVPGGKGEGGDGRGRWEGERGTGGGMNAGDSHVQYTNRRTTAFGFQ